MTTIKRLRQDQHDAILAGLRMLACYMKARQANGGPYSKAQMVAAADLFVQAGHDLSGRQIDALADAVNDSSRTLAFVVAMPDEPAIARAAALTAPVAPMRFLVTATRVPTNYNMPQPTLTIEAPNADEARRVAQAHYRDLSGMSAYVYDVREDNAPPPLGRVVA